MSPNRRRRVNTARARLLGSALLLLSACAKNAPQDVLQPEGPIARRLDSLWDVTFFIAAVIFFLVEGALVFALFRYRRRTETDSPRQISHNTPLEIVWTAIPALLLAGLAVPMVTTLVDLSRRPQGDVLEITVNAKQWWWEYEYPVLGVVTANEMHIPVGRPVYLTLKSSDVIHSFWVPKLAGKQDVVPGRENHLRIEADRRGEYLGQCAEFCGLSHAYMRLRVFAEPAAEFDGWVKRQRLDARPPSDPVAKAGFDLFVNGACAGCHTVGGTDAQARVGPNLTHFASRTTFAGSILDNNSENLRRWLRDPPSVKPMQPEEGRGMPDLNLSEDEIDALIAFLQSLT